MNINHTLLALIDNGGRRSSFDRRRSLCINHIPERRISSKRRILSDRRRIIDRRNYADRRSLGYDLKSLKNMVGLNCRRKQERRSNYERRAAFAAALAHA